LNMNNTVPNLFDLDGSGDPNVPYDILTTTVLKLLRSMPINYVGNKKKLLENILSVLHDNNIKYDTVFDAFCGSSVVSSVFRSMGKKVVANDLLSFSSSGAVFYLMCDKIPLSRSAAIELTKDSGQAAPKFVQGRYEKFFTDDEARLLDVIRHNFLQSKMGRSGTFTGLGLDGSPKFVGGTGKDVSSPGDMLASAFFMHFVCNHVLHRCFSGGRYYSGQTLSRIDKRQQKTSKTIADDILASLDENHHPGSSMIAHIGSMPTGTVYNCDILKLLESGRVDADLAYFDPPYGGDSSDYASLYRVCEEYIRGPSIDDLDGTKDAFRRFRDKKAYQSNFESMLDLCRKFPSWLISFNESSFASIDDISAIIRRFRTKIDVRPVRYRYNYRKTGGGENKENEYLVLAR